MDFVVYNQLGGTPMIEFFLFPNSTYLGERWWHRLATVAFWLWLAGLVILALVNLVELASSSSANPTLPDVNGIGIIAISILYVLVILPSLLYRIVLYVAKGSAWKDPRSVT